MQVIKMIDDTDDMVTKAYVCFRQPESRPIPW